LKLDISTKILNIDGTSIPITQKGKVDDWIFKDAFITVLTSLSDKQETGEAKFGKYVLAQKIQKSTKLIELTLDETKMLKELVGETYAPIVVGQIWTVLDPEGCSGSQKEG